MGPWDIKQLAKLIVEDEDLAYDPEEESRDEFTIRLRWVTTSYGDDGGDDGDDEGEWIVLTDDGKVAGGTWGSGGRWEVDYGNIDVNIDWDSLLDNSDFWQGHSYHLNEVYISPSVGFWDGVTLRVVS